VLVQAASQQTPDAQLPLVQALAFEQVAPSASFVVQVPALQ
jgi:hypothetical protein